MSAKLTAGEEAQLSQTIEMFEVITQSQPQDYQSLEILKEAYLKLGREQDVITTSKRIAQAYVQLGQLSSAILEYETILQRFPNDADVQNALREIESKANNFGAPPAIADMTSTKPVNGNGNGHVNGHKTDTFGKAAEVDDGRASMRKAFVDSKLISVGDFDLCWSSPDLSAAPTAAIEPFIQVLADKGIILPERSLKLLSEKSRLAYVPLEKYDVDLDLARTFPAHVCRRWCILPFDRLSKTVFVATANPFNRQAAKEIADATKNRVQWYLTTPNELLSNIRKAFR